MKALIYDIEVYPNFFMVAFKDIMHKNSEIFSYEISPRKDERKKIYQVIQDADYLLGYNNEYFDGPLLTYFVDYYGSAMNMNMVLYEKVREIFANKFPLYSDNDKNNLNLKFKQIDLFQVAGLSMGQRRIGLKTLGFNIRAETIQELPYVPGSTLTPEGMDETTSYCYNDITLTEEVYKKSKDLITLRKTLKTKYPDVNFNWYVRTDSQIGERIILLEIKKRTGRNIISPKEFRESVAMKDVILPMINFKTPIFQRLLEIWKHKTLTIWEPRPHNVPPQSGWPKNKWPVKDGREKLQFNDSELLDFNDHRDNHKGRQLNVIHRGTTYVFGEGGLHACIKSGQYEETVDKYIVSTDVSSYYPNLAITNGFYPSHIGQIFCDVYRDIYHQRKRYDKTHPLNAAYKIALVAATGKAAFYFSRLYDMLYFYRITINGQLLLLMLIDRILQAIPEGRLLIANTDGCEFEIPRCKLDIYKNLLDKWQKLTKLTLDEPIFYKKLAIRDANSYIAIWKENGKTRKKRIGAFKHEDRELWQDNSGLVVQKAVEAYVEHHVPPERFIANHKNWWDFLKRYRAPNDKIKLSMFDPRTKKCTFLGERQKVVRYYCSRNGNILRKHLSGDRIIDIESNQGVVIKNIFRGENISKDIDYRYYIKEVKKLLSEIYKPTVHTLFEKK